MRTEGEVPRQCIAYTVLYATSQLSRDTFVHRPADWEAGFLSAMNQITIELINHIIPVYMIIFPCEVISRPHNHSCTFSEPEY